MALKVMMKINRYLILMILLFSCEDNRYFTNCDGCTSEEPVSTVLRADLEQYNEFGTLVILWEGTIEDNIIYDSLRVFNSTKFERMVPLNRTYTITATYIIDYKSYTVVDSKTPRVKYTADLCQDPCYYVYDNTLDLTRKYVK
jgi:hypothetical protein